jgi:hypothetical protein
LTFLRQKDKILFTLTFLKPPNDLNKAVEMRVKVTGGQE